MIPSSPPANMNRYWLFKPLNSTGLFMPLLIVNPAIAYRKNDLKMVAATIRKIHAPNQEAATFEVSGSPLLNLL